jgi:hypothetical protein
VDDGDQICPGCGIPVPNMAGVVRHAVYHISGMIGPDACGRMGVNLDGVGMPSPVMRFRPIYRPRGKELIRALIGDRIREDVRVDATSAGILKDIPA